LGITNGATTVVEVPNRPSYVYVQLRSSQYEVIQAFNSVVSPVFGLPVALRWEGNRYVITERDTLRYSNWVDSSSYLPRHASTHEFEGSAGDVVFVSQQQFLPLMPMPSGSSGNKQIVIGHYNLMTSTGTFQYFDTQVSSNLTAWNPTSPTGAQMVLVSLDATNGSLVYTVGSGSVFGSWLTGSADVLPKVPAVTDISRYMPIAAVRLTTGTSVITWDNIYDVRPLFGATRSVTVGGGGGGGGGSSSGVAILNNGVLENYANQINFEGGGFLMSHSGTEMEISFGGSAGASGSLSLDTSNGPLYGPLIVYQKHPNIFNQYFDYSTIVGYMSGTAQGNFGAAVEAVNWSTGSNDYGLYVDDEGSNLGAFIGGQGLMDNTLFELYDSIDFNRVRGRFFSPMVLWTRDGNNSTMLIAPMFQMNERQTNTVAAPTIEIDANFSSVTALYPLHTGSIWNNVFPFPYNNAPYGFDTYHALPTGTVHSYWNHQSTVQEWLAADGRHFFDALGMMEHTGTSIYPNGNSLGMAKLTAGTVTVPTLRVTDSSRIFLTTNVPGGTVGTPYVASRSAGSGFTILSTSLTDTSRVAWLIFEPYTNR
jgi:hypothetical protein